jgi:hypothetical protein
LKIRNAVKRFYHSKAEKVATAGMVIGTALTVGFMACAADAPDIATTLNTSLTTTATTALTAFAALLPTALEVFGFIWVARKGVNFFKSVGGK